MKYKLDDITEKMAKNLKRKLARAEDFITGKDVSEEPYEHKAKRSFLELSLKQLKVHCK